MGEEIPATDRIVQVYCALNNVCVSVVPFEVDNDVFSTNVSECSGTTDSTASFSVLP